MTIELRASVGDGCSNHPQDVGLVQLLLMNAHYDVTVDGEWGDNTRNAVAGFQSEYLGFGDASVDPGDVTFKLMRGGISNEDSAAMRALLLLPLDELRLGDSFLQSAPSSDGLGVVTTWADGEGIAKIYSHSVWGTWEVRGLILGRYLELGDEAGEFGHPISGERSHGNGRISFFAGGRIIWDPLSGVSEIRNGA